MDSPTMNIGRESITIEGIIERITFHNPENYYTVARFRMANPARVVTVVGFLPRPATGANLSITGFWDEHARYGQQLKIERVEPRLPSTVEGIRQYLQSGFLQGISTKKVGRIISHFGSDTLDIIQNSPKRLMEVEGIGPVLAKRISASWKEHHVAHDLMRLLENAGVQPFHAARILKEYGNESVEILTQNPYQAALDMPGVGFLIADSVARYLGESPDRPHRVRACLLYILEQAAGEGHTCIGKTDLFKRANDLFHITPDQADPELDSLIQEQELVSDRHSSLDETVISMQLLHSCECGISDRIRALQAVPLPESRLGREDIEKAVQTRLAIQPSAEQLAVLEDISRHLVAVITGGPGTGKTTLIRSVCAVYRMAGKRIALAAPTGRAARRLAEVTRMAAHTIHRLLMYDPVENRFVKNRDDPIDADVVIVDEASMVDVVVMYHLVQALPPKARLVLVGDRFQLPSVGPGNVLADLIDSGGIRTYELTEVFRQAAQSPIIRNAHRIRHGEMPLMEQGVDPNDLTEYYFFEQPHPESALTSIVNLCRHRIPDVFGFDSIQDIQVITPMHKGVVGTIHLNQVLQRELNPESGGIDAFGTTYRKGDKVMHLKNNYAREIFNGDIGRISDIDPGKNRVVVEFDERTVTYDKDELTELTLAYAISVHKSQGSEYPAVILPVTNQHYVMLQRNLLYTAVTRGKKLVVLIGSQKALQRAVDNDRTHRRLSLLGEKLKNL
jgi:exodeoxyribonuclease V alpha subunit